MNYLVISLVVGLLWWWFVVYFLKKNPPTSDWDMNVCALGIATGHVTALVLVFFLMAIRSIVRGEFL